MLPFWEAFFCYTDGNQIQFFGRAMLAPTTHHFHKEKPHSPKTVSTARFFFAYFLLFKKTRNEPKSAPNECQQTRFVSFCLLFLFAKKK
jgi:hypothetical protein